MLVTDTCTILFVGRALWMKTLLLSSKLLDTTHTFCSKTNVKCNEICIGMGIIKNKFWYQILKPTLTKKHCKFRTNLLFSILPVPYFATPPFFLTILTMWLDYGIYFNLCVPVYRFGWNFCLKHLSSMWWQPAVHGWAPGSAWWCKGLTFP